jgi:hypothetical protein
MDGKYDAGPLTGFCVAMQSSLSRFVEEGGTEWVPLSDDAPDSGKSTCAEENFGPEEKGHPRVAFDLAPAGAWRRICH